MPARFRKVTVVRLGFSSVRQAGLADAIEAGRPQNDAFDPQLISASSSIVPANSYDDVSSSVGQI